VPDRNPVEEQQAIANALRAFAAEPRSTVEAALLVSRIVRPETDPQWCRGELSRLAETVTAPAGADSVVETLRNAGFRGSSDYYKFENSALEHVLRRHEGIPISLAAVIIGVCERLGLPAQGINFPGHFLVAVAGQLVDPFSMQLTDEASARAWLRQHNSNPEQAFTAASPITVLNRMLNNLSMLARSRGDHARALELTDFKLLVSPAPLAVYLERVDLWESLGVAAMARHDLEAALALDPEEALRQELTGRLASLAGQPDQLH
jgi:regulator of sirC expression with transglutaminase-like and TPR domain